MHVIRLRGPWELQPLVRYTDAGEATEQLPAGGRTRVPGDWSQLLGADFLGRARYTRHFNRPTNLDPHERVWLVLEGADHQATIALNDHSLGTLRGTTIGHRVDITEWLALRNQLIVEVDLSPAACNDAQARATRVGQPGGLIGEVRLEIG